MKTESKTMMARCMAMVTYAFMMAAAATALFASHGYTSGTQREAYTGTTERPSWIASTATPRNLFFFQVQVPYEPHILQQVGSAAPAIPGARSVLRQVVLCCSSDVVPVLTAVGINSSRGTDSRFILALISK